MTRQRLLILTSRLAGLAVVFPSAPIPTERTRPSLYVSNLEPGSFLVRPFAEDPVTSSLLQKKWRGEFRALTVPVEDGKVVMPDVHWWRSSGYTCTEFRPDIHENGRLLRDGAIRCHDPETLPW